MSIVTFQEPGDIKTPEDLQRYLAELDRERPLQESHFDRRCREVAEARAQKAEEPPRALSGTQEWPAWGLAVDEGIGTIMNCLEGVIERLNDNDLRLRRDPDSEHPSPLLQAIGEAIRECVGERLTELREEIASMTGELPEVRYWAKDGVAYKGERCCHVNDSAHPFGG
jgi:hypothetical protein